MRLVVLIVTAISLHAQWTIQQSNTTASLRGVHSLGGEVSWASGTNGTVVRTTKGGTRWTNCAVPPGAENLDFRAIQAFDENTAVVMSAGKGELSRLYMTNDGCRSWKLLFTNPDAEGFWDALQFSGRDFGMLIGDPVGGYFPVFYTSDGGNNWRRFDPKALRAAPNQSLFAASNTSLLLDLRGSKFYFATGGGFTGFTEVQMKKVPPVCEKCTATSDSRLPVARGETAGGFSIASRMDGSKLVMVAVGGDFKEPDKNDGTSAVYADRRWIASSTLPRGYRSAVAYHQATKTWIAVGPNGTDISRDDARNWTPLLPSANEAQGVDRDWNALSLPFVVGPKGRIGKLREDALRTR